MLLPNVSYLQLAEVLSSAVDTQWCISRIACVQAMLIAVFLCFAACAQPVFCLSRIASCLVLLLLSFRFCPCLALNRLDNNVDDV